MHWSVFQGIQVNLDAGFVHPLSLGGFVGVVLLRCQQGGGKGFLYSIQGNGAFGLIAFIADDVVSVAALGLGRNVADLFQGHGGIHKGGVP